MVARPVSPVGTTLVPADNAVIASTAVFAVSETRKKSKINFAFPTTVAVALLNS